MTLWNHRFVMALGLVTLLVGGATAGGAASMPARERIAEAKVGVLFQRIVDEMTLSQGYDVPGILDALRVDVVFRAWWTWGPCPPDCAGLSPEQQQICAALGYSYRNFADQATGIRAVRPSVVIIGSIPAQKLPRRTFIPGTFEVLAYPETWDMALDPEKWGLPVTKKQFQCYHGKLEGWVDADADCSQADSWYDPSEASAYFPDLTDPRVEDFLFAKAKAQIDAGADAIWIDMLGRQTAHLYSITCGVEGTTCDPNHPAVVESYAAACALVDRIRAYGAEIGRDVAVGSWGSPVFWELIPGQSPALDFVTATPSPNEVWAMTLDPTRWNDWLANVHENFGNVPAIAFIDWAYGNNTPLAVFSQVLTPEQQREFLRLADTFFAQRGILFAYPVHGGYMGYDAATLSYGEWFVYDSMAPEFSTFSTIAQLAAERAWISRRPRGRVRPGVAPSAPAFPRFDWKLYPAIRVLLHLASPFDSPGQKRSSQALVGWWVPSSQCGRDN